jgi:hypothetical protein
MEAGPSADHPPTFRLAAFKPVLAYKLDDTFVRLRAAGREENPVQVPRGDLSDEGGEFAGRLCLETKRVQVGQLFGLDAQRLDEFGDTIAETADTDA